MRWKSGTARGISKTKIVREINGAAQNIKTGEQAIFFLSEVQAEMSCHNS
jgi:hypothetical protein